MGRAALRAFAFENVLVEFLGVEMNPEVFVLSVSKGRLVYFCCLLFTTFLPLLLFRRGGRGISKRLPAPHTGVGTPRGFLEAFLTSHIEGLCSFSLFFVLAGEGEGAE